MRTVRWSSHLLGKGVCPGRMSTQGCLPGGVSGQWSIWPGGCLPRGVSAQGVSAQGVSAQGSVCPGIWQMPLTPHLSPWTEFLTHAWENITFPQLRSRKVKIGKTPLIQQHSFMLKITPFLLIYSNSQNHQKERFDFAGAGNDTQHSSSIQRDSGGVKLDGWRNQSCGQGKGWLVLHIQSVVVRQMRSFKIP